MKTITLKNMFRTLEGIILNIVSLTETRFVLFLINCQLLSADSLYESLASFFCPTYLNLRIENITCKALILKIGIHHENFK